ncbi:hypothetical protein QBC42DRAFT_70357 [Cladorrhinum samala]|uniref:Uncharacterized protein n=1 Tax=Cladorrhinum samala TaxID=585594 RepID=A0AAV9HRB1_9PEZI|nr:hypothetical protein QBC42DRAFT_70357 [Cladorrhinum samala]
MHRVYASHWGNSGSKTRKYSNICQGIEGVEVLVSPGPKGKTECCCGRGQQRNRHDADHDLREVKKRHRIRVGAGHISKATTARGALIPSTTWRLSVPRRSTVFLERNKTNWPLVSAKRPCKSIAPGRRCAVGPGALVNPGCETRKMKKIKIKKKKTTRNMLRPETATNKTCLPGPRDHRSAKMKIVAVDCCVAGLARISR